MLKLRHLTAAAFATAVLAACSPSSAEDPAASDPPEQDATATAGDETEFCEQLVALDQAGPPEVGGNNADEFAELTPLAPTAQLRDDVELIMRYHRDWYVEGDANYDSFDAFPPEVQQAVTRVHTYGVDNCGLPE